MSQLARETVMRLRATYLDWNQLAKASFTADGLDSIVNLKPESRQAHFQRQLYSMLAALDLQERIELAALIYCGRHDASYEDSLLLAKDAVGMDDKSFIIYITGNHLDAFLGEGMARCTDPDLATGDVDYWLDQRLKEEEAKNRRDAGEE